MQDESSSGGHQPGPTIPVEGVGDVEIRRSTLDWVSTTMRSGRSRTMRAVPETTASSGSGCAGSSTIRRSRKLVGQRQTVDGRDRILAVLGVTPADLPAPREGNAPVLRTDECRAGLRRSVDDSLPNFSSHRRPVRTCVTLWISKRPLPR